MNKIGIVLVLVFCLINVSALCNEGQIDINNAGAEELDKLVGIGVVKSQAIVDARPFNSVNDLIDVYGIGEITLKNIKEQGLACVENEVEGDVDTDEGNKNSNDDNVVENEILNDVVITEKGDLNKDEKNISTTNNVLILENENVIKLSQSKENKEIVYESKNVKIGNYVVYGFALFLIFVILVLLIRS